MKVRIIKAVLVLAGSVISIPALAQTPVWGTQQLSPHVGLSFTHYMGGGQVASANELGFSFSFQDDRAAAYDLSFERRPALLDMRFGANGLSALNVSGVNALMPKYMLGAEEGGGFFSHINWGIVAMAVSAGGLYYLADKQNDDRDDDAKRDAAAPPTQAPASADPGGSSPIGDVVGGVTGALGI